MKKNIFISLLFLFAGSQYVFSQEETKAPTNPDDIYYRNIIVPGQGYKLPMCNYNGELIPYLQLPTVYIFKPLVFKNDRERRKYYALIRNVKKTLPIACEINKVIIETYEYLQTIPDPKEREKHLKNVEKGLKEQYTPQMKKLTFTQGKLLIKLINRETQSSSYELVKAFIGPLKAGFYQAFAAIFGASLRKEYHPDGEDWLTEQVVLQVANGQL